MRREFSIDGMVEGNLSLYREILDGQSPGALDGNLP
jgi:hypothetical protein